MYEAFTEIKNDRDCPFDWDSSVTNEKPESILFREGDYPFEVVKFERDRFVGSAKMQPCNMAVLTLRVRNEKQEETSVIHRLYLNKKVQWKIHEFCVSIGQARPGDETVQPRWNEMTGARGICHLTIHEYTGNDCTLRQSNQVAKFLPPPAPTAAEPAPQWVQGRF